MSLFSRFKRWWFGEDTSEASNVEPIQIFADKYKEFKNDYILPGDNQVKGSTSEVDAAALATNEAVKPVKPKKTKKPKKVKDPKPPKPPKKALVDEPVTKGVKFVLDKPRKKKS